MKRRFLLLFLLFGIGVSFSAYAEKHYLDKVEEAAKWLREVTVYRPELMVVLTAEVEGPLPEMDNTVNISYSDIPYFPFSSVLGHEGKVIFGRYCDRDIVVLKGRCHYYEGWSAQEVAFPYFVMKELGVNTLITINAVGALDPNIREGSIVLVKDHVNFLGDNPLKKILFEKGLSPFVDMSKSYDPDLQQIAEKQAKKMDIDLQKIVYIATTGPNYETPAEIEMFRKWGGETIGMSTIFEVIACQYLGIKVLAINCVTNSPGTPLDKLSHEHVLEKLKEMNSLSSDLIKRCIKAILG